VAFLAQLPYELADIDRNEVKHLRLFESSFERRQQLDCILGGKRLGDYLRAALAGEAA